MTVELFQDTAVMKSRPVLSKQGSAVPTSDKGPHAFSLHANAGGAEATQTERLPLFLHASVLIQ